MARQNRRLTSHIGDGDKILTGSLLLPSARQVWRSDTSHYQRRTEAGLSQIGTTAAATVGYGEDMTRLLWVMVLAGCAERSITPLGEPEEDGEVWVPQEDLEPEDTVIDPGDEGDWDGSACAPSAGDDDSVEVSWCARLTPEGDELRPTDDSGTGTSAALPPPPPCGFYNLLGAVQVTGDASSPWSLYCDSDEGGGLRLVRYDTDEGLVEGRMLREGGCRASALSGAILPHGDSSLAWWLLDGQIYYAGSETTVMGVRIDGDGAMATEPVVLDAAAARIAAVKTEAAHLLLGVGGTGELWAAAADTADGDLIGAALPVADGVDTFSVAPLSAGAVVAACPADRSALDLVWLSGIGSWQARTTLDGSHCMLNLPPAVATQGEVIAVVWEDDDARGRLRLLDSDGALIADVDLGEAARSPTVVAGDGVWWTLDGTGMLRAWSLEGALLSAHPHPQVPAGSADLLGLQAVLDADTLAVQVWSREVEFIGGHAYTFDYLELSVGWLPSF